MNTIALRISVVCPVHNTLPELLHAAVRSVIAVAGPHLHELLLVDDASTSQETVVAIEQIAAMDSRVVVMLQRRNGGPSAARTAGIRQASGDWIGFIDSDDLWMPGRIEAVLPVLEAFPDAGWIAGNYQSLYCDGATVPAPRISQSCQSVRLRDDLVRVRSPELTRHLISDFRFHMSASLIKKDFIQKIGELSKARLDYHEDCLFLARLSMLTPCYFIEQELYLYRRDVSSLMSSPRRLTDAYAASWRHALRDKALRGFRRESRWMLYKSYKGLAINNLLNAKPWQALWFALRAWLLDPREIGELALFLRMYLRRNVAGRAANERRYSTAERFMVDPANRWQEQA